MVTTKTNIDSAIKLFIEEFTKMDIDGIYINCPYWMNKIVDGQVKLRGFWEGKGTSHEIRQELAKRLHQQLPDQTVHPTSQFIQKFAKRERIGIDCSGFVFRVLDKLVQLGYRNCTVPNLSRVFTYGIRRTNANTLTSKEYCLPVKNVSLSRVGDLIRMMNGKHVAVILQVTPTFVIYAHSARTTRKQGVHLGTIRIIEKDANLDKQKWLEQTRKGENFGQRYFHPDKGDGVFRLKIFA